MGAMSISGVAVSKSCNDPDLTTGIYNTGLENVIDIYNKSRMSRTDYIDIIEIMFCGGTIISGLVGGMSSNVRDPNSRLFSFRINMYLIPLASKFEVL